MTFFYEKGCFYIFYVDISNYFIIIYFNDNTCFYNSIIIGY